MLNGDLEKRKAACSVSGREPVAGERQHQANVAVALIIKILIGIIRAHMIMKR